MDTKELPAHPSLEFYKNQAKNLLKAVKSGNDPALQSIVERIQKDHPRPGRLLKLPSANLRLADVQFIIARDYGFESWPRFAKHIAGLTRKNSTASRFELAI